MTGALLVRAMGQVGVAERFGGRRVRRVDVQAVVVAAGLDQDGIDADRGAPAERLAADTVDGDRTVHAVARHPVDLDKLGPGLSPAKRPVEVEAGWVIPVVFTEEHGRDAGGGCRGSHRCRRDHQAGGEPSGPAGGAMGGGAAAPGSCESVHHGPRAFCQRSCVGSGTRSRALAWRAPPS